MLNAPAPLEIMGPTLPPDLWLHIATFLCKAEIWSLRLLNHTFLHLALVNRFSTLLIVSSKTHDWTYARRLRKFR